MDVIFEITIARFIFRFLGLNIRFFILKIFNETLKKEALIGNSKDYSSFLANDVLNAMVGSIVSLILFYIVGWLFF